MLSRTLLHIYGPFCIYSYGFIIAIGAIATFYLIKRNHKRLAIISDELLLNVFSLTILSGVIGGRLLYLLGNYNDISSWFDICAVHKGGLSILGSIITVLLVLSWYLKQNKIPVLPFLDLLAIYAPLLQSFSRLGCLFAGCCFGKPAILPWAIIYKTQDTLAPTFCSLHPTQLYSALGLFLIFIFLHYIAQYRLKKPGLLMFAYLTLVSLNRFVVDFYRGDQEFFETNTLLSIHQWIALSITIGSLIGFIIISRKNNNT
ncbi:MAG: prolipoprotein diacylglyceryl transferase [Candidatus Dependentiae bacterium]